MPGGANWTLPGITSNYATAVLQILKQRDEDALTLLGDIAPSNIPTGAIKYNRATFELQEWDGAAFVARKFAITSGGTGATTAADARTNLGIGTLGVQNSNAVTITGGSISGLTTLGVTGNATVSGTLAVNSTAANAIDVAGGITAGSGNVGIIGTDGRIPAISSTYFADLSAIAGATVPSGLIAMFDTACPSGWTRVSALDGRFPRGAAAWGATGGATLSSTETTSLQHQHGFSASAASGIPSTFAIVQLDDGSAPSASVGANNHTHSTTISGTTGNDNLSPHAHNVTPLYVDVVWCRKN